MERKIAATSAAVQAVIGALVLLGILNLTDEQIAGIMGAVNAVMLGVFAWFSPTVTVIGPKE